MSLAVTGDMRTALLPAILLGSLAIATSSPAHAGTYVSLGMGGVIDGKGALSAPAELDSETPQQRLAVGQNLGRLAIEASVGRVGLGAGDARIVGLHGRLGLPLDGHLSGYVRVGVERAWVRGLDARLGDSGSGLVGGVGLEYRISAPLLGEAAIWAEVAQDDLTFDNDVTGGLRTWTLGASLGL